MVLKLENFYAEQGAQDAALAKNSIFFVLTFEKFGTDLLRNVDRARS